jgi:hypothetical protein
MAALPTTLDDAIAQAKTATQIALEKGYTRLQVEFLFPELKPIPVAQQFVDLFAEYGETLKVFFTDAGAAALVRRDWGTVPFKINSLDVAGSRQTTAVQEQIAEDDRIFLFVAPTAVEAGPVEQICEAVGDRPVVLLNPRLEDFATVGIGYAGRQLRMRFLSTFEPAYYLRPLDEAALFRCYPDRWQIWSTENDHYTLLGEEFQKPDSDSLELILAKARSAQNPNQGIFAGLQKLWQGLRN